MKPRGTITLPPNEPPVGPPSQHPKRRRKSSAHQPMSVTRRLILTSLVIGPALILLAVSRFVPDRTIAPADVNVGPVERTVERTAARRSRLVYRHSVIPGGVYSQEELVAAADRDPVVFARYGSLSRTAMRAVAVAGPRHAHMSYRIGDQIYWTKRKLPLLAGEMTLTNGSVEIRS